jgi:hypothetical protein
MQCTLYAVLDSELADTHDLDDEFAKQWIDMQHSAFGS